MAMVFKLSWFLSRLLLSQLDSPHALLFIPVAANNSCIEVHVLAKAECLAHFVEILPDIWGVREEARPICIESELILKT